MMTAHYSHVAMYYQLKWEAHKCIAWNLLRRAYRKLSCGEIGPMELDFIRPE